MFESAPDTRHRRAIDKAHAERGALVAGLWKTLFARRR